MTSLRPKGQRPSNLYPNANALDTPTIPRHQKLKCRLGPPLQPALHPATYRPKRYPGLQL